MVRDYFLIMFVFCVNVISSQNNCCKDEYSILFISTAPVFNGDLNEFIEKNTKYPENWGKNKIEGMVIIEFWIDTIGNTYNHKVIKGIRIDLDNEALRVVRLVKFEKPAYQKNMPIPVRYVVPVKFHFNKKVVENIE